MKKAASLSLSAAAQPETIAAIATPPGKGGVGIVRLSGPLASKIAHTITGRRLRPRYATLTSFANAQDDTIDSGIALFFPGPASFTGEDILELQGHGGPIVMDLLLHRTVELGARLARPGEFSERAFLNNKLDLAQAEAIADLIDSSTTAAAQSAIQSLSGAFSDQIHALVTDLINLRVYTEAAIDFPDEEIDFLADELVATSLKTITDNLTRITETAEQGRLLRDGMSIVLAGQPNVGKSSLMNALSNTDTAIVTPIAGTTRDILREQINLNGMPLQLSDTAGLRDNPGEVEQEGIRRAWRAIEDADHLLLVIDDNAGFGNEERQILKNIPQHLPCTLVYNKIDQTAKPASIETTDHTAISLSAKSGTGLELLRTHLQQSIGYSTDREGVFTARRRHIQALKEASEALSRGTEQLIEFQAGELLCEELKLAQRALGTITGEFSNDDLLTEIFSSFCIGK